MFVVVGPSFYGRRLTLLTLHCWYYFLYLTHSFIRVLCPHKLTLAAGDRLVGRREGETAGRRTPHMKSATRFANCQQPCSAECALLSQPSVCYSTNGHSSLAAAPLVWLNYWEEVPVQTLLRSLLVARCCYTWLASFSFLIVVKSVTLCTIPTTVCV